MIINDEAEGIKKTEVTFFKGLNRQVSFYARFISLKSIAKIEQKVPI